MTKEQLEELLADKPANIKADGAVLYNAVNRNRAAYNQESNVANLRNMEAAKEAFDKFVAEIGGGVTGDTFDNLLTVLKWLQDNGWKAARQSLYRHHSQGKIIPNEDGKYTLRAVKKYAETFLKQTSTGKRVQQNADDLQREKLEQELKNLKLKNERETFNFEKDKGLYVPKEQLEIELATRAGIFLAGLKHWIQSKAADWIDLVGGDTRKVGEIIHQMTSDLDDHINQYAGQAAEYDVIIEPEKTTEPEAKNIQPPIKSEPVSLPIS